MDQYGPPSDITQPGSIHRVFKHFRGYPTLPAGYDWVTQKQRYCPRDLLKGHIPRQAKLTPKFDLVFCHRGLYERASRILENSASAIENGIIQSFFLHEVDAFILEKLDQAIVAHDKVARRITSKENLWQSYSFYDILKTVLVSRGVETESPDFASSYLETHEKVLGLLSTLWKERLEPVGRTLQIDLRGEDFAKAIPHYSFHISKRMFQYSHLRGAHQTLVSQLFQSTILKGYNVHFKSFDHLHEIIKEKSNEAYGRNCFELRHLHLLPPLVMVFYSQQLVDLAMETKPIDPQWNRKSYQHLRYITMKQVSSFVGVGDGSYNFILEIAHSGLGLGYNVQTGKATNPLNGEILTDKNIIFESRVDRAMIDVSLELRQKYPQLLFSSCTRLPDVITSKGKFKADFRTSRLVPWKDGEKGISTELRAIHGGLFPQSHIVVADNPTAEIAARTWIDQKAGLDRSELLQVPYHDWLAKAGKDVVDAIGELNSDFLPNKFGDPVEETIKIPDHMSGEPERQIDLDTVVRSWLNETPASPNEVLNPNMLDPEKLAQESIEEFDERLSESDTIEKPLTLNWAGKRYIIDSPANIKRAALSRAAYREVINGNEELLQNLLSKGANVNTSAGRYGTALEAACARSHSTIVHLLLKEGAEINEVGKVGCALELASASGNSDIVKLLLTALTKHKTYIDTPGKALHIALQEACLNGHETVVQLLLDKGGDVNFLGGRFHTALQAACYNGNMKIIGTLLVRNATINAGDNACGTALRVACTRGHHTVVKLLLEKGANINAPKGYCKSPLYFACSRGHASVVKLLLGEGADIDFPWGTFSPEIVSILAEAGADVDKQAAPSSSFDTQEHAKPRKPSKWTPRMKRQKAIEIKQMNALPRKLPPKLRSCGCLLCRLDQKIQPAVPQFRMDRVRVDDPVTYTLRRMKIDTNLSSDEDRTALDAVDQKHAASYAAPPREEEASQ